MNSLKKNKVPISIIYLSILLISIACLFLYSNLTNFNNNTVNGLVVHYIDVGQGDSILIQTKEKNMLIDSGPNDSIRKLSSYLNSLHIKKLDYVIATHPHEDHIGNMDYILKKYTVTTFMAPKVTTNSSYFNDMITELKHKNMNISTIRFGNKNTNINLGDNIKVEVLGPVKDKYEKLNNYSAVIRISYNNTSFLFTGDCEKEEENDILKNNTNIHSDVLKVGHHGSSTSTTKDFLDAVSPKIAVISVGKDNSYNHPSSSTLSTLKKYGCTIYRTDNDGNITLKSDGENIRRIQ